MKKSNTKITPVSTTEDQELILVVEPYEAAAKSSVELILPTQDNAEYLLQEQELKHNEAHEEIFNALSRAGVSSNALAIVFGIESRDAREDKQKKARDFRFKLKNNN